MCGIAGIFAYHQSAKGVDQEELLDIRDYMTARGPDDAGLWVSDKKRVGLAHRRLSIIDPGPTGHQPMHRGKISITYNGEIYNFRILRYALESRGFQFQTGSDTEVLLALYEEQGIQMVNSLIGMFALAIWDAHKEKLFLARDPYGIKPVYYSEDGKSFRFASQVKALLAGAKVSRNVDPAAEVAFLMLGSVPEPLTYYSAIRSLPAGSMLEVDCNGVDSAEQYCSVSDLWSEALANKFIDGNSSLSADFKDSVRRHLVSDVPVGVFLSAGIDSGAIAGIMSEIANQEIDSITLKFEEFENSSDDESILAKSVAKHYGINHHIRTVAREEFDHDLPAFLDSMDQPTIDGLNTWFISKAASEKGIKVMLSGVGGDELLGSYPSFKRIPTWIKMFGWAKQIPSLGNLVLGVRKFFPEHLISPKAWGLFRYGGGYAGGYFLNRGLFMPWDLAKIMPLDRAEAGINELRLLDRVDAYIPKKLSSSPNSKNAVNHASISALESCLYLRNQLLRDTDWSAMAHSVEVRTPLVDIQLLKNIAPKLLNCKSLGSKSYLAESPVSPLPEIVPQRSKTGFTTPVGEWIQLSSDLDQWKSVPMLADKRCHWSRRYAYSILAGF